MCCRFLFLGGIGMQEILLLALIVLLLFGGRKIPELMKGLGRGVRSFKEGVSEIEKDVANSSDTTDSTNRTDGK